MTKAQRHFPADGVSEEEVLKQLDDLLALDLDNNHMALSARSMKGSKDVQAVSQAAFNKYFHHNAVYSPLLPSVNRLEDDLIGMCIETFNAGPEGRANLTSGGTESIFCAIHALREWARNTKPHIETPEIVAPYSAHASFSRVSHYLGFKLVRTPLGEDHRADPAIMRDAITPNTVGIVGSAPCWPYGLIDPLAAISDLAVEHDLWMHVDACLGGYLAPFVKKAGYPLPDFDFTLPGVRSISADLHKYGHAPKPISSVLYRSVEQQKYHYTMASDWPGRAYLTQAFTGSRPAGTIASAWAIFTYLGEKGKIELARRTMQVKERLTEEFEKIGGLQVWRNDLTPMVVASDKYDPTQIVGGMVKRGWLLLGIPKPQLMQFQMDAVSDEVVDMVVTDMKEVIGEIASGKSQAKGGLGYVFSAEAEKSFPLWFKQALEIAHDISREENRDLDVG